MKKGQNEMVWNIQKECEVVTVGTPPEVESFDTDEMGIDFDEMWYFSLSKKPCGLDCNTAAHADLP